MLFVSGTVTLASTNLFVTHILILNVSIAVVNDVETQNQYNASVASQSKSYPNRTSNTL